MTQPSKNKIPGPVYAVAGAGDLAYRQLRRLPVVFSALTGKAAAGTAELRERAVANSAGLREKAVTGTADLREKAVTGTADLREKAVTGTADLREKAITGTADLREVARRNAAAFVTGAQVAQEKATAVYEELVARGARVIGRSAQTATADAELESEGAAAPALPAVPASPYTAAQRSAASPAAANAAAANAAAPKRVKAKATKAVKRTRPADDK